MVQYSIIFKMLLPWMLLSTWCIICGLTSFNTGRKNCPITWGKKKNPPPYSSYTNLQILTVENKIKSIYKKSTYNIQCTRLQRLFPQYLPWLTVSQFTAETWFMIHILFIHSHEGSSIARGRSFPVRLKVRHQWIHVRHGVCPFYMLSCLWGHRNTPPSVYKESHPRWLLTLRIRKDTQMEHTTHIQEYWNI